MKQHLSCALIALAVTGILAGADAVADVAGTLEDYLVCPDESNLTKDKECVKCIAPEASSEVSWEVCSEAAPTYQSTGYEKVCQSGEYYGSYAEVWCKGGDAGVSDDTDDDDTDTGEGSGGKGGSDGCTVTRVGDTSSAIGCLDLVTLLVHF